MRAALTTATVLALVALWSVPARGEDGAGVLLSKHNLSRTGPGSRSNTETQVCRACHVPHGPPPPLSRAPVAPPGAGRGSQVCLGCHDGTVAASPNGSLPPAPALAIPVLPPRGFGTDILGLDVGVGASGLGRSHPIGVTPSLGRNLRALGLTSALSLRQDRVECATCHDPHEEARDPVTRKFLARDNRASGLCLECHDLDYWAYNPSVHQTSQKRYDPSDGAHTGYSTVADNGCESCHRPHNAAPSLLKKPGAAVCLDCHQGRVAAKDLRGAVLAPYGHPVLAENGVHDPTEGTGRGPPLPELNPGSPRHVTCVDCHNPHAVYSRQAEAPFVSGALANVRGITLAGEPVDPARYEYELCFKCHGDSRNQTGARRSLFQRLPASPEPNLRLTFDVRSAPSFHPIEGPGRSHDVPSLIPPLSNRSMIYCSDCHSSDAAGGPRGPHGSAYPGLLERPLAMLDHTPESPQAYALCYKCHDRAAVLSPSSPFPTHTLHVVRAATPCTACHDPHGVSARQGNASNNAHLINFDTRIVGRNQRGLREYASQGPRSGRCSSSCHGKDHDEVGYQ